MNDAHCMKCIHYDICKIDADLISEDFVNFFPHNEDCVQFKDKAEIESLLDRIDALNDTNKRLMESQEEYWKNKVREFAERLKSTAMTKCDWDDCVDVENIDNLLEEMVSKQ